MKRLSCSASVLLLLVSLPAHAGKKAKVDVCHITGSGSWNLISVSENAVSAHLGHGDVLAGAWYLDSDGDGYGDEGSAASECPESDWAAWADNADDCGDGGAASGPGFEEIGDGFDNDCDGWADEGLVCPCFDAADLDDMTVGLDTYAMSWAVTGEGITEVSSLRAYTWLYDTDDAQWQSPVVGADVYRVPWEDDAPYCEVWDDTWLAAPDHSWAGDGESWVELVHEDSFAVCEDVLYDWIDDNGVSLTSW